MDIELLTATRQVKLALITMRHRQARLETTRSKLSRHYNRLNHTRATIGLLEELAGMMIQDPDHWDDEPELAPF